MKIEYPNSNNNKQYYLLKMIHVYCSYIDIGLKLTK